MERWERKASILETNLRGGLNMSRVYDNYVSRYLTDEDELIYPSDEALDEYAQQWEELQRKELCYGNNKNGS